MLHANRVCLIDAFAGPGGFDEGFRLASARAGLTYSALGIELDPTACRTAETAGHRRIATDITGMDPSEVRRRIEPDTDTPVYLHASPPCQSFSNAGKRHGRRDLDGIVSAIESVRKGEDPVSATARLTTEVVDDRSRLVLEVLRWVRIVEPTWVSAEQVPAVLPIWEAIAVVLDAWGYTTWTGTMASECFGVPQTRRRAILMARRPVMGDSFGPPAATHSKFHNRTPDRLDEDVQPWVPVQQALGWTEPGLLGFPRRADSGRSICLDGTMYRERDLRSVAYPAFAVTEKARSWQCYATDSSGLHVVSRSQLTPAEAGVLQGFRPDYPWTGSRTAQFLQIANAVPPPMAAAIVGALVS